eukprot:9480-Rhodomonas_salina.1
MSALCQCSGTVPRREAAQGDCSDNARLWYGPTTSANRPAISVVEARGSVKVSVRVSAPGH